jgi:hypothetical protein
MECGIPSGVAQGAVLSLTLFNIFTSDFSELDQVHLELFADDSALFTSHSKADVIIGRLQTDLNYLRAYYSDWRIEFYSSKTQNTRTAHFGIVTWMVIQSPGRTVPNNLA